MTEIRSLQNPRLKALRKLHTKRGRASSQRFLAEGEDLVAAAARAGRDPVEGYRLGGTELGPSGFLDVEAAALGDVSSLGSGTRVIGVYEQRWGSPHGPLCVYLHGVGDPGNVGTVLRSAQAFGASCVVLGPGCADPHSPKAVRASMGAVFAVELARAGSVAELPGRRIALSADAPEPLRGPVGPGEEDVTLLIGAERGGLPAEVVAACEQHARIPIDAESLNAAMAATVALYEMTRTRQALRSARVPAS
ncbi:MAG: methyltransferase, TrmH family [Solirubrobacteraceae bacterium]|jgi:TrmH family RNA methyltransferase|nr:methyltransferase, TrmH family [Solirubrobacteraceae bacterium]